MPDTATQNSARMLPYSSAAFAKIAVSNAIWLTGEWLAQGEPTSEQFAPQTIYIFEPRYREEALALLNNLPEALRHEVFCRSFMRRPCSGGEHLFQTLRSHYREMLDEAIRLEWSARWGGRDQSR